MGSADDNSYGFQVEWHDPQADMIRKYQLTASVPTRSDADVEVAMYDPKNKRSFLKRTPIAGLRLSDFTKGGIVTIAGRQLKIVDHLDSRTELAVREHANSLFVKTSAGAFQQVGKLIACIEDNGLRIKQLRLVNSNGPVVALEVVGADTGSKWNTVMSSLSQGALAQIDGAEFDQYLNKDSFPTTAALDNCTLGVIRPHVLRSGNAGQIVAAIQDDGFEISAAKTIHLTRTQAEELMEVYSGVLPYYNDLVEVMTSGPCLALELRRENDVVERFRSLCGPYDVDMAKHLRPNTLRARFGLDNPKNAVHSTDLEGDAEREVQYVFEALN